MSNLSKNLSLVKAFVDVIVIWFSYWDETPEKPGKEAFRGKQHITVL